MNSLIFRTATGVLLPVMLVLSIVVLLRGHNEPGGGFVGGLVAAAAFSLHTLSHRGVDTRALLRLNPLVLVGVGLLTAAMSGVPGLLAGSAYLEGLWLTVSLPGSLGDIKLGTPLLFDIGVYLLVLGGTMVMVLSLEEACDDAAARA